MQIHEVAAALFEKSKKSVVGDGSYLGFVRAVLAQVPTAAAPPDAGGALDELGYLVYSQVAGAVQRRASARRGTYRRRCARGVPLGKSS